MARNLEAIPGTLAWALPKGSPFTRIFVKGCWISKIANFKFLKKLYEMFSWIIDGWKLISRFMELHEDGLIEFLIRRVQEGNNNVTKCLDEARWRQQKKAVSGNARQISLGNFSGAFYVLIIGYFISFVCFIHENIYYRMSKCFHKRSYKQNLSRKEAVERFTIRKSRKSWQQ